MDASTRLTFEQIAISLLMGLLVGFQRQHSASLMAGVRTFPIISVLGTLAATFDQTQGPGGWLVPCGFIGLVVIVAVGKISELRMEQVDFGITTEVAILLMYLLGAYVVVGERIVAIAVGAGVAVLLQFKPELHGIATRLGDDELRAIMTFALITCIILPVLPNSTYDLVSPLNVLNPFEIWTMVVLMVGISLGGYLTYKFLGRSAGIVIGGILGGAISSTVTTVSYARRSRASPDASHVAAVVIMIASTVVYGRVILECGVVAGSHFTRLALPIAVMMGASGLTALWMWLRVDRTSDPMPLQSNPTELKSSLMFAGLYAGVLMALAATKTYLGGQGLFVVAILSGLTDMDAITLSTARLVGIDPQRGGIDASQGWRVIIVATMSNLFFKWILCLLMGQTRLVWRVGMMFAVPMIVGGCLLWLWP